MSQHETPTADADFDQQLQKLRLKIDSLTPEQRPHLYELADTITRQHRQLQDRKSGNDGAN